jgi:hypothetical protein
MIKALPRRRTVTLISAWRCHEGIVLHADSQETNGSHRVTVQKLNPEPMGALMVVVTGSGDGNLIQSFIIRLRRRLAAIAGCLLDMCFHLEWITRNIANLGTRLETVVLERVEAAIRGRN